MEEKDAPNKIKEIEKSKLINSNNQLKNIKNNFILKKILNIFKKENH